ncbi:MAG: arsenite methyltransferase [Armatimonadota bacterium]|nr:arsenite methyltransferase [Armatimonadota bacterium]
MQPDNLKRAVRARYAQQATRDAGCGCCCGPEPLGYDPAVLAGVPEEVRNTSLGCGSPVSAAGLKPGEVVVDLGSGAGLDLFLAARAVTEEGHVVGVDMTPEMIERAERNARRLDVRNVSSVLGDIEALPLPDAFADVILSNCVINLLPDKARVFREAYRVLRPGGRLVVSDILASAALPQELREDPEAWSACLAGALPVAEYLRAVREAGFVGVRLTRGLSDGCGEAGCCSAAPVFTATVIAVKPTDRRPAGARGSQGQPKPTDT